MSQIKELLIAQLQDLLHAESQLTAALPKMAAAASHPKLKEAFEKHLVQTNLHVDRLHQVFELLGETAQPKPCKAMMGLVAEGEETIEKGKAMEPMAADLALIAAAQRVEHYEISSYGTARGLARQMGEIAGARLLSNTLGDEQSTDFLLTTLSDPMLQEIAILDMGADVELDMVGDGKDDRSTPNRRKKTQNGGKR